MKTFRLPPMLVRLPLLNSSETPGSILWSLRWSSSSALQPYSPETLETLLQSM